MIGDSVKECEARLSSLRHVRAFVDMNIRERIIELKEAKKNSNAKKHDKDITIKKEAKKK